MDSETLCLVSLNAYHRISQDSFFRRLLTKSDLEKAKNSLVFQGFSKLLELAKETKDYFVILKIIEQNIDDVYDMLSTGSIERFREKFNKLAKETDKELLDKFETYFKEEEAKL